MILRFSQWLEATDVSQALAGSIWTYPIIESLHVVALILALANTAVVSVLLWSSVAVMGRGGLGYLWRR